MALPTGKVIGIMADNLRKRKNVIPLSAKKATAWAEGLNLPRGGETVIFTGLLYQLMPGITGLASKMASYENSFMRHLMGMGRLANKFINVAAFMGGAKPAVYASYNRILRNIACLLKKSGVEFGYLYEQELYSGALLHDNGVEHLVVQQAQRVWDIFQQNGVKEVITTDPHTTNMLRSVYPELIEGYDLKVRSYLEVLAEAAPESKKQLNKELVIHDSCMYARYEDVIDEPRQVLAKIGVKVIEPDYAGKLTWCCGGPVESLFPAKSKKVAETRIAQLSESGKQITAMCPICVFSLQEAAEKREDGTEVRDIVDYLSEAYCLEK